MTPSRVIQVLDKSHDVWLQLTTVRSTSYEESMNSNELWRSRASWVVLWTSAIPTSNNGPRPQNTVYVLHVSRHKIVLHSGCWSFVNQYWVQRGTSGCTQQLAARWQHVAGSAIGSPAIGAIYARRYTCGSIVLTAQ